MTKTNDNNGFFDPNSELEDLDFSGLEYAIKSKLNDTENWSETKADSKNRAQYSKWFARGYI